MKLWFLLQNGDIQGPLSSAELIATFHAGVADECMFWWKGFKEWQPLKNHADRLETYLQEQMDQLDAPVWKFRWGDGEEQGPFTYTQFTDALKQISNPHKNVLVRTIHEPNWQAIFFYPDLMEQLGISLRSNLRVALDAEVSILMEKKLLKGYASTVSLGGVGVRNLSESLTDGAQVKLQIKSSHLPSTIHVYAKVAYSKSKETGFVFESLHPEYQSMLSYHIRKLLPESLSELKRTA